MNTERPKCVVCGCFIPEGRIRRNTQRPTNTCSIECTRERNGEKEVLTFNHCSVCGIAIPPWANRCDWCIGESY